MLRFNLQYTIWWWQSAWSDGWTPESITKFGWFVKIRYIQEAEFSMKHFDSFITWCRPWNGESASSRVPSIDILLSSHQVGDRALKSPRIRQNKRFESVISFIQSSNEEKKFSNWSLFWLGDLYVTAMKPLQFFMNTSQRLHSLRADKLMILTPKDCL